MELIDQHTKQIMEGCKERALDAGLRFDKATLEYMVTNSDLLELSPKNMIPTLYDYWLQDIEVLRGKGEYEYFPNNPYETVINTRPAISFYNNENPDWMNVMIFYHVIAHIDFFQNNKFFEQTWDYDFKEKALTEKRIVSRLRSQKGRIVDYVIEFTRGIDNLVGYFDALKEKEDNELFKLPDQIDYYFNYFLQNKSLFSMQTYLEEIDRYNLVEEGGDKSREELFLMNVNEMHPEFEGLFQKFQKEHQKKNSQDLMQFLIDESEFINKEDNLWIKSVMGIVRDTSLYFSPQIRTKIMNEGWASYWHEKLFLMDDRIHGHEVAFAKVNAKVTSLSRVGLNPYAIGWRLFMHIEDLANKGKYSYEFRKLNDIDRREKFDTSNGKGKDFIFHVRENFCDLTFLSTFIEQDFVDRYKLMVVGQRINNEKNVKEYYVKSKKAKDYKSMILDSLYHPPFITFARENNGSLFLHHHFEGKELYPEYIPNTMIGLEYLWGKKVLLETMELDWDNMKLNENLNADNFLDLEPLFRKVLYTVENRKVKKEVIK
ncbi:MAG: SpoVR family protein [Bacteroidetes bacterium]|nr:SpoVR family protein [Bacteroidota bacterium]